MSDSHGPLDIPLIGDIITKVTVDFAQKYSLQTSPWYHDAPLWKITQHGQDGIGREVQIAAWNTSEGETLYFVPLAERTTPIRKVTPHHPDKMVKIPLRELYIFAPKLGEKAIRTALDAALERAWNIAAAFGENDLTQTL